MERFPVDLILTNSAGLHFVKRLRDSGDATPVVVLSKRRDALHKPNGFIQEWLPKPVTPEALQALVERFTSLLGDDD
jgi:DNA-binding response OmpR family regulator